MGVNQIPAATSTPGFSRSVTITSSGTWTHPDGASSVSPKPIKIVMTGGGGGGGSGAVVANMSTSYWCAQGGNGGSSGLVVDTYAITTGDLTITIGTGGTGGSTTNSSSTSVGGNTGNDGGTTSVTFPAPYGTLYAFGGGGGNGNYYSSSYSTMTTANGVSGGTASPGGASLSPGGGSYNDLVGFDGLSSGASSGQPQRTNTQNGNSNFFGQGDANAVYAPTTIAGYTTSAFSDRKYVKQSSLPAGSGAMGGSYQNQGSFGTQAGGTGGTGFFGNGGNGGASNYQNSGTVTATAGSTPSSGYGGGGGGGGAAGNRAASSTTSGAGGAGNPGAVIIFY